MNDQEPKRQALSRPWRRGWVWVAVVGIVLVVGWCGGIAVLSGLVFGSSSVSWGVGDAVAVVYIEGAIGGGAAAGGVDTAAVLDAIAQAERDGQVKAIVAFVNSPGGSVVPSDEMYQALLEATKPTVAAMGDVAASGGYYVACGADKIVAHPASITGSIGVYAQLINAADLLDKLGVEGIIIRSGDSKATGNWFEHPTAEQLATEQAIVDELYDMFVGIVATSRDLSEEQVRGLADGRAYTGRQALGLGLIDELGSLDDAIQLAAQMGGIAGEPRVVEYRHTPSVLDLWLGARAADQTDLAILQWLDAQVSLPEMRYTGQ